MNDELPTIARRLSSALVFIWNKMKAHPGYKIILQQHERRIWLKCPECIQGLEGTWKIPERNQTFHNRKALRDAAGDVFTALTLTLRSMNQEDYVEYLNWFEGQMLVSPRLEIVELRG